MKINPLIAKQPEDLQQLDFKKMKAIIKKDLKRLEKYTSIDKPTPCIVFGEHTYTDKDKMALVIFGKWQGKFKQFAKKEAIKDSLGAIGTVYFDKIDEESGQKIVQIALARGKGKKKVAKIQKTLKKLIPQASYNIIFSEISEEALDAVEQNVIQDSEETIETPNYQDSGEIDVKGDGLNLKKLLTSNLKEISSTLGSVKKEILPKIKTGQIHQDDLSTTENLLDLCEEWQEMYDEASFFDWAKVSFLAARAKVEVIQHQLEDYLEKMRPLVSDILLASDINFSFKGSASALSPKAETTLRNLLAKAGESDVAIVNTLRSAQEQASVMYMNIKAYGPAFNRKQYKDKAAAGQVIDVYERALTEDKDEAAIIAAMLVSINNVGAEKLSDHCNSNNPAIDIHPSSIKNKVKFEEVLKNDSRISIICPPQDTTYHIVIKE